MLDLGIERGQSELDRLAQEVLEATHQSAKTDAPPSDADTPSADKAERRNTAKELIDLAVKHCDLFHDERGDGYAVVKVGGIRRTLKLRSREFKRWQAGTFYAETGRAANNEAASSALSVLEAKATFDNRMLTLHNRFAMVDGNLYLDMADTQWRAIKVTPDAWEVLDKPPVLFRRYSHQQALPDPVRGGKLSDIHQHLTVKSDDDKLLVEAWLVASAFADIPRPIITFHGPEGSSKSTAANVLKSICDPSVLTSVDIGKNPSELAQVLDHHGTPCFDNLTNIPIWAADMLCRAVTGGAFTKRELFTDGEDVIMSFKRPMIITGINIPTHAPDLLDRLLMTELERVSDDKRMDEATFWRRFNQAKPQLFGALLTALSRTLKHLPKIKLDKMPRMADFAKIACAYAEYSGTGAQKMLDVIMAHTSRQTEEVLESDSFAAALRHFVEWHQTWTGTAKELLDLMNEKQPTPKPEGWPKAANSLTRKINVLHATLNKAGISIRKHQCSETSSKLLTLESRGKTSTISTISKEPSVYVASGVVDIKKSSTMVSTIFSSIVDTPGAIVDKKNISTTLKPLPSKGIVDIFDIVDKSALLSSSQVEVEI